MDASPSWRKLLLPIAPWWRGVLFIFLFLWAIKGCQYVMAQYTEQQQATRAAPYLEAANAERRQVGLWPIPPTLTRRWYDDDTIVHLDDRGKQTGRFRPYVAMKDLKYSPTTQCLLWEIEHIVVTPARVDKHGYADYLLTRKYSFTEAAKGRNPWTITFADQRRNRDDATVMPLTYAASDSILAYWRAQGLRDSLAAVSATR